MPVIKARLLDEILRQRYLDNTDPEYNPDFEELITRLSDAVIYFTEARLIETNSFNLTAYGIEVKETEFGNTISSSDRTMLANNSKAKGTAVLNEVVAWLNSEDSPDYGELWAKECHTNVSSPVSIKIKAVGRTHGDDN